MHVKASFRNYAARLLLLALGVSLALAVIGQIRPADEDGPENELWQLDLTAPPEYPTPTTDLEPRLLSVEPLERLPGFPAVKPVVSADHTGRVLIASQASGDNPPHSEIFCWRSRDYGATWSRPELLTGQPSNGEWSHHFDPWMVTDRRGRFYLLYARITGVGANPSNYTPALRRSRNGGDVWSPAIAVGTSGADRPVLGVSPEGSRLVVASSAIENVGHQAKHSTGLFVSTDYGGHWKRYADPLPEVHAVPYSVVVDEAGRVASTWIAWENDSPERSPRLTGKGCRSVLCITEDQGTTWTETTLVPALQSDRPHPFAGGRFAVLAIDGQSGLQRAFVTAGADAVMVASSKDWQHWSEPRRLSSERAKEARLAAISAWGPRVHLAWMERRDGSEHDSCWNAYYRVSGDYGQTWSSPLRLAEHPASTDFAILPDEQTCVAEDGEGQVHVVWAVRDGRVLHARIQLPGVSRRSQ